MHLQAGGGEALELVLALLHLVILQAVRLHPPTSVTGGASGAAAVVAAMCGPCVPAPRSVAAHYHLVVFEWLFSLFCRS